MLLLQQEKCEDAHERHNERHGSRCVSERERKNMGIYEKSAWNGVGALFGLKNLVFLFFRVFNVRYDT